MRGQDKLGRAVEASHATLDKLGVQHFLGGKLAARAHGTDAAPKRIDYVVSGAFVRREDGVKAALPGLPVEVHGVAVRYHEVEPLYAPSLLAEGGDERSPAVLRPEFAALFALKGTQRDHSIVSGLLRAGMDPTQARVLIAAREPRMLADFDRLLAAATRGTRYPGE